MCPSEPTFQPTSTVVLYDCKTCQLMCGQDIDYKYMKTKHYGKCLKLLRVKKDGDLHYIMRKLTIYIDHLMKLGGYNGLNL
jgi:hypothetical protein